MNLKSIKTYAAGGFVLVVSSTLVGAQVGRNAQSKSGSASHVAAELTEGRLNSAKSQPGDTVLVKLKDDVKSNGAVVFRKGTTITGVVRIVKRAGGQSPAPSDAKQAKPSMMEVEWVAPTLQSKIARDVSIALQYVGHTSPAPEHQRENANARNAVPTATAISGFSKRTGGQPNAALLSMPSVVVVDAQTGSTIENGLGMAAGSQLFKVGGGQLLTATGTRQSVDIFSYLNNDSVIMSASDDFDIATGARMRLLVGVTKK
jgi:hypothetical protein